MGKPGKDDFSREIPVFSWYVVNSQISKPNNRRAGVILLNRVLHYVTEESQWAGKHHVMHDAFRSTATCKGSSIFFILHPLFSYFKESQLAGKHHVLHDAFRSTATCRGIFTTSKQVQTIPKCPQQQQLSSFIDLAKKFARSRSLGGPESIISPMMLSGLPRPELKWRIFDFLLKTSKTV